MSTAQQQVDCVRKDWVLELNDHRDSRRGPEVGMDLRVLVVPRTASQLLFVRKEIRVGDLDRKALQQALDHR